MADKNVNEWFRSASTPITDMAYMLVELDKNGVIPEAMRQAIRRHAFNARESAPLSIGAISNSIGGAIANGGLDTLDAANAAWGVASLADALQGMTALNDNFSIDWRPSETV